MSKSRRRSLEFDCLEGKILLSSGGMARPAATVYQSQAQRFRLNGELTGVPSGVSVQNGFVVGSFPISGRAASMGHVQGTIYLSDTWIHTKKLPDLSKASVALGNQNGSVFLSLGPSASHRYHFTIVSGTGVDTFASGSGTFTVTWGRQVHDFIFTIQTKS
jgi:hypothetical protein